MIGFIYQTLCWWTPFIVADTTDFVEANYIANLVKANNSKIPVHHRNDWIHMPNSLLLEPFSVADTTDFAEAKCMASAVKVNNAEIPVHHRNDWIHRPNSLLEETF
jgi:hypothetical protein